MFSASERERIRNELIAAARADARVTGAALVGSAAVGREDRWSDIDLALCVDADRAQAVADWSERMYRDYSAIDHLDVTRGQTLYRVFLLDDTLQVDLSFWSPDQFGATGPSFRVLFGTTGEPSPAPAPAADELIGLGWLYALHARSSIARGRIWQAEYMVSGARDHVLALACLRHHLPAVHGRGMDDLPPAVTATIAPAVVGALDTTELHRALCAVVEALLAEVAQVDTARAARLAAPLRSLAG